MPYLKYSNILFSNILNLNVICLLTCIYCLARLRNGMVYKMYHGTFEKTICKILTKGFYPSKCGMLGQGVYLSRDLEEKVVIRVKVNVGKVKTTDCQDHPLQKTWHDEGYDSAWVPPNCGMVKSGLEETCVWDPNQWQLIRFDLILGPFSHAPSRFLLKKFKGN
uniref:Grass carp reovirus (GCRV)-induced gene 2p n=1 Tax=Oncorhynchus tshawytscha TaxID=74940 RepID=A0A8C8C0P5_ONCTS